MRASRGAMMTVFAAFVAGFLGALLGATLARSPEQPATLHERVHAELDLTPEQDRRLDAIEAEFAVERTRLEAEMRAANAELAAAIEAEKGYGPKVTAAVDHFHMAMGALQKASIEHVFAMRAVLTPEQAARFDRTVVAALTDDRQ